MGHFLGLGCYGGGVPVGWVVSCWDLPDFPVGEEGADLLWEELSSRKLPLPSSVGHPCEQASDSLVESHMLGSVLS